MEDLRGRGRGYDSKDIEESLQLSLQIYVFLSTASSCTSNEVSKYEAFAIR
jgi:hypothetical protein